jgi:hypothetical protein
MIHSPPPFQLVSALQHLSFNLRALPLDISEFLRHAIISLQRIKQQLILHIHILQI